MLCCTLGVAAAAPLVAAHQRSRVPRLRLPFVALAITTAGVVVATHVGHYAARAELNGRSLLAEIAAAPLCTGAPLVLTAQSTEGDQQ